MITAAAEAVNTIAGRFMMTPRFNLLVTLNVVAKASMFRSQRPI